MNFVNGIFAPGVSTGRCKTGLEVSGKFGQRAKMYPTRRNGYENDKATELFRQV